MIIMSTLHKMHVEILLCDKRALTAVRQLEQWGQDLAKGESYESASERMCPLYFLNASCAPENDACLQLKIQHFRVIFYAASKEAST